MKSCFSVTLLVLSQAAFVSAAPLTGSGANLPLPGNTGPTPPGVAPVLSNLSGPFTGTWSSPAPAPWLGTFTGTGSYPSSGASGTSVFDFSGLAAGELPAGTYVRLSDLDGSEVMTLRAFDASAALITSPWLEEPVAVSGLTPSEFVQANLPGWDFTAGVYTFTGAPTNTLLFVSLATNVAISGLQVDKADINNGLGLAAEVPEPGSLLLLGMGLLAGMAAYGRRLRQ